MKEIMMSQYFNSFCADSDKAIRFLNCNIKPLLTLNEDITFNFDGIRNMTSSFSNALFSNLTEEYGKNILTKIKFLHCRDNIRILVSAALELGLKENKAYPKLYSF